MQPLVFFGTEIHSLIALQALHEADFHVAVVVTKPDTPRGRGNKLMPPAVKQFALEHNMTVWQPTKLTEIVEPIRALQPIAGVLVSYGKIIPQSVIRLFSPGIINLHPSLLPKWRGPSPIEAAIMHGDRDTGVSIMQLDARMDAGPIYTQSRIPLTGHETKPELYNRLFTFGSQLLVDTLPQILSRQLTPTPQDDTAATYCHLLSKDQSLLNPATLSAAEAATHVRAYLGFPRSRLRILGREQIITRAHAAAKPATRLDVQCADGCYLVVDELIAPSGKTMPVEAFLRGYQK